MLSRTRERLANEAATWRHLGLIDDRLASVLAERYDARGSMGLLLLKWLAFFGIFMLCSAVIAFVGIVLADASPLVPGLLLAGVAAGLWHLGARLSLDPARRHPLIGAALLTVSLMGLHGALSLVYVGLGGDRYESSVPWLLLLTSAAALATAYRFRLRWPLLLGLMLFFHAVGSWHAYGGHGSYFADIQDERVMAVVALLAAAFGVWHESRLEAERLPQHVGFGGLYIIFGLLYLNLSLWFLSIGWRAELAWVLVFTAAAIGQIVAGAFLKDSRFTGFGIVFLSIDIYTRFFEHFWDRLEAGSFFTVAGGLALAAGAVFERTAKRGEEGAV